VDVIHHRSTADEVRVAAKRMIAATEYFKASGDLPSWARADLDAWNRSAALLATPDPRALAASR
jgi:hypothetical protein